MPSCGTVRSVRATLATWSPGPHGPETHPAPLGCRPCLLDARLRPVAGSPTYVSAAIAVSLPSTAVLQQLHHLGLACRVQALREQQGISGGTVGPGQSTQGHVSPCPNPHTCHPTCLRLRLAQSSRVCAASSLPWRRYRAPKLRRVVLTVGLWTG